MAGGKHKEVYTYLGYQQSKLIDHKEIENTTKAIKTYAIPLLTMSLKIFNKKQ